MTLKIPPPIIPPALAGMAALPQWICWQLVQRPNKPKPDKVPTNPQTRLPISLTDPANHMTSENVLAWAHRAGLGVGFVFTEQDPYAFLDIDGCAITDPNGTATWAPHALRLLTRLSGAAVETSCSGRGLHVFGRCAPGLLHSNRNDAVGIELYTSKRFVALGTGAIGNCDFDVTGPLTSIAQEFFPPSAAGGDLDGVWTDTARPGSGIPHIDLLLKQALKSRSVNSTFGDSARFKDLFEGNTEALAKAYPDATGMRVYDESRADAALAAHLAFWTGDNCQQIWDIMWKSALVRPKWYDRDDYVVRTIMSVVGTQHDVYTGEHSPLDPAQALTAAAAAAVAETQGVDGPLPDDPRALVEFPYVPHDQVLELWRHYVYVVKADRVLTPKGDLISEKQFRNKFSRSQYPTDFSGTKSSLTGDAWKAYMEASCYDFPKAEYLRFMPQQDARVVRIDGDLYANLWVDPKPVRKKGDATPLIRHVKKILPNGNDAEMLLAYMAACVQHQGTKFTWCPLIQGVQGNGKSTLGRVLARAIGEKYVHEMEGGQMTETKFTGWLSQSVVVVVHDLKIRRDALNKIKPMITETRQSIERKRIDQSEEHVCANFLLTTNHKDAIPLDRAERRFAVFLCAQQTPEDLKQQGFTAEYFKKFFHWLEKENGYEICADFLWECPIPDAWNPATDCRTAPVTTTREEALEAALPEGAMYILEEIRSDTPGFCGGWVSSLKVRDLLIARRSRGSNPKLIGKLMTELGYIRHPGLGKRGQASCRITEEGGRPALYVRRNHLTIENLSTAAEITGAYVAAQNYQPLKSDAKNKETGESEN